MDFSIFRCKICNKVLVDAVTLPCLDSFCQKCIKLKVVSTDEKQICPICKEIYDSAAVLRPHQYILTRFTREAVIKYRIDNLDVEDQLCDALKSYNPSTLAHPASFYCLDCNLKYCTVCIRYHNLTASKISAELNHQIVELGKTPNVTRFREKCTLHPESQLKGMCLTCKELVCDTCHVETCDHHDVRNLDAVINDPVSDTVKSYPRYQYATSVIATRSAVQGVTVVGDEMFVIKEEKSDVEVYDTQSLVTLSEIDIPGMGVPNFITGCVHKKALYISDWKLHLCIHRVDLTNNSVTRWTMRADHFPKGLSVTAEHNVLVTVSDPEDYGSVLEYTSEGEVVREIRLDESIWCANQTVQLSSNQFIVCHGLDIYGLNRVCEVNAQGQIIKSYGGETRRGKGKLFAPVSLTVDNNKRRIFVADTGNHRVILFDYNLTYLGQVHTSFDLKDPNCLHFDSSTDRLFVGCANSCRRVIVISL